MTSSLPFARLLARHCLPAWLEEARAHPECRLAALDAGTATNS